jgi:hypothetical protein
MGTIDTLESVILLLNETVLALILLHTPLKKKVEQDVPVIQHQGKAG